MSNSLTYKMPTHKFQTQLPIYCRSSKSQLAPSLFILFMFVGISQISLFVFDDVGKLGYGKTRPQMSIKCNSVLYTSTLSHKLSRKIMVYVLHAQQEYMPEQIRKNTITVWSECVHTAVMFRYFNFILLIAYFACSSLPSFSFCCNESETCTWNI